MPWSIALVAAGSVTRRPTRQLAPLTDLVLDPSRGLAITLVPSRERKRRQPGFAADGPAFVRRDQLIGGIERAQVHFDFVAGAREDRRAAARTEKPPGVVARFTMDRHCIAREYCGSVKKRPVVLPAVETVAKADPVWKSPRLDSYVAAQATAGESVHASVGQPVLRTHGSYHMVRRCACSRRNASRTDRVRRIAHKRPRQESNLRPRP
jgi:hypothetical protein